MDIIVSAFAVLVALGCFIAIFMAMIKKIISWGKGVTAVLGIGTAVLGFEFWVGEVMVL